MLSICIPIFNFDVRTLLTDLLNQSEIAGIPIEICCLDDGSSEFVEKNQSFIRETPIKYQYLKQNIGRASIRNKLAQFAQGEVLLYLDCDVQISPGYLEKYFPYLSSNKVVYGGTTYHEEISIDPKFQLHYLVGHKKESVPSVQRKQDPYLTFKTNNFLVPRPILLQYPFDETITQYGHEDTLWAFDLSAHSIPILHIDNPITHLGLETNEDLVSKIEKSLLNLLKLRNTGKALPVKVFKYYQKYRALLKLMSSNKLASFLRKKLLSGKSTLRILDLYKLIFLTINDNA